MFEKSMAGKAARELTELEVDSVSGGSVVPTDSETEPRWINGVEVILIIIDDSRSDQP